MDLTVACLMGFSDQWDNDWLDNDGLGMASIALVHVTLIELYHVTFIELFCR